MKTESSSIGKALYAVPSTALEIAAGAASVTKQVCGLVGFIAASALAIDSMSLIKHNPYGINFLNHCNKAYPLFINVKILMESNFSDGNWRTCNFTESDIRGVQVGQIFAIPCIAGATIITVLALNKFEEILNKINAKYFA